MLWVSSVSLGSHTPWSRRGRPVSLGVVSTPPGDRRGRLVSHGTTDSPGVDGRGSGLGVVDSPGTPLGRKLPR